MTSRSEGGGGSRWCDDVWRRGRGVKGTVTSHTSHLRITARPSQGVIDKSTWRCACCVGLCDGRGTATTVNSASNQRHPPSAVAAAGASCDQLDSGCWAVRGCFHCCINRLNYSDQPDLQDFWPTCCCSSSACDRATATAENMPMWTVHNGQTLHVAVTPWQDE